MKKLFLACTLLLLLSAHITEPLCGYNGLFTFKLSGGNATSAHITTIDPVTLQPVGTFDTVINCTPNVPFEVLVPYSASNAATIWVEWSDGILNMATSNNLSCAPLFIKSSSVYADNQVADSINVHLQVSGEERVSYYRIKVDDKEVITFEPDLKKNGHYQKVIKL